MAEDSNTSVRINSTGLSFSQLVVNCNTENV